MADKLRILLVCTLLHSLLFFRAPCASVDGRIKTLVILVMENRSFDHMLGWMKRINPHIDGVTGYEWNTISTVDPKSARVFFDDEAEYVDPNPGHYFEAIAEQVFGSVNISTDPAPMNGFAQQAASISPNMSDLVMKGFRPDHWFSSLPGPTQPNRLFVYSGTSHRATHHDLKQLAKGYPQKTIFQSLHESGLSFGIYYHSIPTTLFYRDLRRVKYISTFHRFTKKFKRHARAGRLPNVVVIEPRYFHLGPDSPANDDHPSHDVSSGRVSIM